MNFTLYAHQNSELEYLASNCSFALFAEQAQKKLFRCCSMFLICLKMGKITVINYDLVWRRAEFMRSWGYVVLDESHFIKHRTSRRAKFILKLSTLAEYRYILTGTPIGNSHREEIWAPYNFLDPSIFVRYSEFEKRYCILNQFYKPFKFDRQNATTMMSPQIPKYK